MSKFNLIMKIAIIGCGFVGSALANGIKPDAEVLKIDPKFETNIEDLSAFMPDAVFICYLHRCLQVQTKTYQF